MPDSYSLVRQAILEKGQIHGTYRGRFREMCPHVLGTKNGRRQALFFQFGGESERGLAPGGDWRCLAIDDLTDLSVRDGRWHTDDRYRRPQSCVDKVDVEVPR